MNYCTSIWWSTSTSRSRKFPCLWCPCNVWHVFMANYVCTNIAMPNWPVNTCLIFTQICRSARNKTWPLDCHLSWLCSQKNRSSKCEDAQYWWILSILTSNYIFCQINVTMSILWALSAFIFKYHQQLILCLGVAKKRNFIVFVKNLYLCLWRESPNSLHYPLWTSVLAGPNIFLLLEISHHIFDKLWFLSKTKHGRLTFFRNLLTWNMFFER